MRLYQERGDTCRIRVRKQMVGPRHPIVTPIERGLLVTFEGLEPERQGHNLAMTAFYVHYSQPVGGM